jgi:hypothetical protein
MFTKNPGLADHGPQVIPREAIATVLIKQGAYNPFKMKAFAGPHALYPMS